MPQRRRKAAGRQTGGRKRARQRSFARRVAPWLAAAAVVVAGAGVYGVYLTWIIAAEFEARRWDVPAQVYAAPLELYAGRALTQDDLFAELERLGYREDPRLATPGTYRIGLNRVELATRGFAYAGDVEPASVVAVTFDGGAIDALRAVGGSEADAAIVRLDPPLIGSLFPAHGEDRLIVPPERVPPLLLGALKAVEDRRFDRHLGIDLRAVVRAALANISAGEIRQGASTLTQQLVRSFFLSNERTWWRKLREAAMALALELRYEKDELLHAYVNEIYLGQDGARAVHGFGLASQFYFGQPLDELELHELALLVAVVRGPTYYDPRRHPDRALQRRDLVLEQMAAAGLIDDGEAAAAADEQLELTMNERRGTARSAFLSLVRRQLASDYAPEDLERKGLTVLTTLDAAVQAAAERALTDGLERLGPDGAALDGAIVVTSPHGGEVNALVGGRKALDGGFNRALDARRPIGSLVKPAVYLTALETGRYTLATLVDDAPIDIALQNGNVWSPRNFDDEARGLVPLVRALAESLNMATVRLGMDVGLEPIAATVARLRGGDAKPPQPYPSLLLGAVALTPLEVAEMFNTFANGGFRAPLRAVRSVVAPDGSVLNRYPIAIEQAADPDAVYAVNQALVQVMERGTGRSVRSRLPPGLVVAGKTGTSDDFRDSWFAGFTNDRLVVAWLGADDNRPIGLTGSTGAARIAADVLRGLAPASYEAPLPASLRMAAIDYATGEPVAERCDGAVLLPFAANDAPSARRCIGELPGVGGRILDLLRGDLE
jgi:penicillin-binding protein 1B